MYSILGNEHPPDSLPKLADGTCAFILRFFSMTIEVLNCYTVHPFSVKDELLMKIQSMGKRLNLFIVSGTAARIGKH